MIRTIGVLGLAVVVGHELIAAAPLPQPGSVAAAKVGTTIAASAIGEPVRAVTLAEPSWVNGANGLPAYCRVNGAIAPIDASPTSRPINFSVALPASWSRRAVQLGG